MENVYWVILQIHRMSTTTILFNFFPGTHWTAEIVHNINFGPEKARTEKNCTDDFAFYDMEPPAPPSQMSSFDELLVSPHPWIIRTHLCVSYYERFLKQANGPKFIFVLRNPKDIIVSYYYVHRDLAGMGGMSWNDYFYLYQNKKLLMGDIFDQHLGWWKYHDHPNVLFVHYEDLLDEPAKQISQLATFLGHSYSEEQIQAIVDNTSFKRMYARPNSQYSKHITEEEMSQQGTFIRKGQKGQWHSYFTDEQNAYVDSILEARTRPQGLLYKL